MNDLTRAGLSLADCDEAHVFISQMPVICFMCAKASVKLVVDVSSCVFSAARNYVRDALSHERRAGNDLTRFFHSRRRSFALCLRSFIRSNRRSRRRT